MGKQIFKFIVKEPNKLPYVKEFEGNSLGLYQEIKTVLSACNQNEDYVQNVKFTRDHDYFVIGDSSALLQLPHNFTFHQKVNKEHTYVTHPLYGTVIITSMVFAGGEEGFVYAGLTDEKIEKYQSIFESREGKQFFPEEE